MPRKILTLITCLNMALLGGFATAAPPNTPAATAQITRAEERIVGYFSPDSEFSQAPTPNGYTRKLLGRTAEGFAVVQDFYTINGNPRTAAYVLFDDEGLYQLEMWMYAHGNVVSYYPDGSLFGRYHLDKGILKGKQTTYFANGKIFHDVTYNDTSSALETTYFDDTGKRFYHMVLDLRQSQNNRVTVYDAQGKAHVFHNESNALIKAAETKIDQDFQHILTVMTQSAGQNTPEAGKFNLPHLQ